VGGEVRSGPGTSAGRREPSDALRLAPSPISIASLSARLIQSGLSSTRCIRFPSVAALSISDGIRYWDALHDVRFRRVVVHGWEDAL
jgi:hypothetical protein